MNEVFYRIIIRNNHNITGTIHAIGTCNNNNNARVRERGDAGNTDTVQGQRHAGPRFKSYRNRVKTYVFPPDQAPRLFQFLLVRRFRWVPRDEVIEALEAW